MGLVKNNGSATVYDVNIRIEFYLGSTLVDTMTDTTTLPATFPGDTGPFVWYTNISSYDFDKISARITSWKLDRQPVPLPITVVSKFLGAGSWAILEEHGEIRNDQTVTLKNIKVVVSEGGQLNLAIANLGKTTLAPGETTTYIGYISWPYPIGNPDYTVWAQGEVQP